MKKCKKELALNKINKTIRSLAKKKTAWNRDVTANSADLRRIRDSFENCTSHFHSLDEMHQFLEKHKLP
jgi:predicted  nucleic acid-binding Zn-ribbon protein